MQSDQVFRYEHRVTYAECTVGNHVYHSRYLDLLEAARGAFMRHIGQPVLAWQEAGYAFPIVEAHLCYHRPARYDDLLLIDIQLTRLDRLHVDVHHLAHREDGSLIVVAETRHIFASLDEKPRRMPKELAEALRPYLIIPAAERRAEERGSSDPPEPRSAVRPPRRFGRT